MSSYFSKIKKELTNVFISNTVKTVLGIDTHTNRPTEPNEQEHTMKNYLVRYTAQDEYAEYTGTNFFNTLEEAQADAAVSNAAMKPEFRHWAAFSLVPVDMPLTIPMGHAVVIEPHGDELSFRIECRTVTNGNMADFGEVTYWYPDGANDIMQGEAGTLIEATQALVNFTAQS